MSKLKDLLDWMHDENPQTIQQVKLKIVEMLHAEKQKKVWEIPKLREVITYFVLNGYCEEAAIKAFEYYSAGDWHDSRGKKIMNWKLKMKSVWFTEENKKAKIPAPPQITQFFEYKDYVRALNEYNKKYGYNLQKSV